MSAPDLAALRRYAVARSLFSPLALADAIERLGFVQADPIRAPARAQDLILRQRVRGYRDGDLERRYPDLAIEEDVLHNYGFLPRRLQRLLHPRRYDGQTRAERQAEGLADAVLDFVRRNGATHPKALEAELGAQRYANYWGGQSKATTGLLDSLHYRGQLRVLRRDKGIRVYATADHLDGLTELAAAERFAALGRLILELYAPLPLPSFRQLLRMLNYGAPQLRGQTGDIKDSLQSWREQGWLAGAKIDGEQWLWPAAESMEGDAPRGVRLLAPFDPVVWDRRRFELFWGWAYRFEAYTPAAKRQLGYYALPLLHRDRVIGWANLGGAEGRLQAEIGLVGAPTGARASFDAALDRELEKTASFLGLDGVGEVRWRG